MAQRRNTNAARKKSGLKLLSPAALPSSSAAETGLPFPQHRRDAAEMLGLVGILLLAALLRVWHLDRNGFGNTYYAAAVRSMLQSWHNFFFVSFDPAGWVTVDKPPLALWIQTASAKLLGYSGLSVLLPQAVEGVAGVALLYALVRRAFDRASALTAALILALTPLSVAVDRYNNVDACLVLVVLLSAGAILKATESGRRSWLLAAAALGGLAFNTKMLMGFIYLPAFYAVYLVAAPGSLRHRVKELGLASVVLAVVSLSWMLAVDWTPVKDRPYVGSSKGNSMLELSLGWNGLQRFSRSYGRHAEPPSGALADAAASTVTASGAATRRDPQEALPNGFPIRPRRPGGRFMGGSPPGALRLEAPEWAGQILWFLPLTLLGLAAAARRGSRSEAPKGPLSGKSGEEGGGMLCAVLETPSRLRRGLVGRPDRQSLFFWVCWFAIHVLVFSTFSVVHTYYLVLLAPAMAALTGISLRALSLEYREGRPNLFPVVLLVTALWQAAILEQNPDWSGALWPFLAGGSSLAALGLASASATKAHKSLSWRRVYLAVGAVALLVCPLGWALTPVLSPTGDGAVQADPTLITGTLDTGPAAAGWAARGPRDAQQRGDTRLLAFLVEHRQGAKYLVAAQNSQAVTPLIIASGQPAIALGGFMGGDPIVTATQFAAMVHAGDIRYFLLGGAGRFGAAGLSGSAGAVAGRPWAGGLGRGNPEALQIAQWVSDHGQVVDPSLWRTPTTPPLYQTEPQGGFFGGRGRNAALQLYDLSVLPKTARPFRIHHHRGWRRLRS